MPENTQNNIPQLPPPPVHNEEEYWQRFVFDASRDYPDSLYLFKYKDVKFSPFGGIQAVTGQKKNGKTFFLEMLVAAALCPDAERVKSRLQGLTINPEAIRYKGHALSVLYVDTEQEPLNTSRFTKGVNWLCGYPVLSNNKRFHILRLRNMPQDVEVSSERVRVIKHFVPIWQPDLIIIDGLRDLVKDFNDNAESVEIINWLMSMAEEQQVSIWNALHYNPRPGADDVSKMRGHLGTELGNKVTDTFVCSKKKDPTTDIVTFCGKQTDARSKDVPDINYEVTTEYDGDLEIAVPRIIERNPQAEDALSEKKELNIDDIAKILYNPDSEFEWPNSKRQIRERLLAGMGRKDKREEYIRMAIEAKMLIVDKHFKTNGNYEAYRLNPALNPYVM